jgi:hypothetical protein
LTSHVYGIGYLVTSIYLGTLGMGLANPLKPRTAAAGALLCFLMGLTLLAGDAAFRKTSLPLTELPQINFF